MSNIIDVIKIHCNDNIDKLKTCRSICVATGNELDEVFIRTENSLLFPY